MSDSGEVECISNRSEGLEARLILSAGFPDAEDGVVMANEKSCTTLWS